MIHDPATDTLPPLEFIAAIEENSDLLNDAAGDLEVDAPLAERLLALDLPGRAKPILQKLVQQTQSPIAKARYGATLATLDAVIRFAPRGHIILVDESDIALALAGSFDFTVERGARVSIHPLTPTRFAGSDGLKYPLDGLLLAPGVRTGTSNEASAETFSVTQAAGDSGIWLLLLERRWLKDLISRLAR